MRHAAHFARLVAIVVIVVAGFFFVRSKVVPKDFGVKGHYRLSAIDDEKKREPRHVGSADCTDCHEEIGKAWTEGKHHHPQCENCHGPGLMHVKVVGDEPTAGYPDKMLKVSKLAIRRPTGIQECKWCHLKTFERPSTLKSISSLEEHWAKYKGTFTPNSKCVDCHDPHTTVVTPGKSGLAFKDKKAAK
jgi:formate-dependent nitrite reductase cytochrome c552 subunit